MNRLTVRKAEENSGYCENCIAGVGRQLITTRHDQVLLLDIAWRESVKSSLIMLLHQLRDANYPEPWYGLSGITQSLALRLGIEQHPWINDNAPEIDGNEWEAERHQQIDIEEIEELIY